MCNENDYKQNSTYVKTKTEKSLWKINNGI